MDPPRGRQQGFTAIEMVSAVAILLVLGALVGMIFAKSDRIWTRSLGITHSRSAGRTAIGMLTDDLEHTVTDAWFPFVVTAGATNAMYGLDHSALRFVTLSDAGADGTNRAMAAVGYTVRPSQDAPGEGLELIRYWSGITNHSDAGATDNIYWNTNWVDQAYFGRSGVMAEHVTAFRIGLPVDADTLVATYDSREYTNRLPAFVDMFIELLSDETARQLSQLPPERQPGFIEQHAVRYTARVNLHSRWSHAYRGR